MMRATEGAVLRAFTAIHGELSGNCSAEIIYGDEGDVAGVACVKDGNEAWRASLAEMAFDLAVTNSGETP